MSQNFLDIQKGYLRKAWSRPLDELEVALPARYGGGCFHFQAFGGQCELHPDQIILDSQMMSGPEGVLIAMYASFVTNEMVQLQPLKAFKQFPGGMGYQGAFTTNAEKALIPYVEAIQRHQEEIIYRFSGHPNKDARRCDFSFTIYSLPRIPLYYIFNRADEEFPASVTCLFASNADRFIPVAGLADTAEYTAKKVIQLVTEF